MYFALTGSQLSLGNLSTYQEKKVIEVQMLTKHVTVTALLAAAVLLENSVLFNYLQREHCMLSVPAKSSGLQAVL